ncbi:unnamed protein product [Symbiodinium necroappetens]|uniref:Uncharacterized protein n=1 Tax=Symbiodinium necroappetens TaxID=1628268 RepID=A0A813BZJ2_9DINO|nr:unnamed protein product [Symbiodinium necroappetens]
MGSGRFRSSAEGLFIARLDARADHGGSVSALLHRTSEHQRNTFFKSISSLPGRQRRPARLPEPPEEGQISGPSQSCSEIEVQYAGFLLEPRPRRCQPGPGPAAGSTRNAGTCFNIASLEGQEMFGITIVGSATEKMGDTVKNCLVLMIYLAMETVEWQRLVMEQEEAMAQQPDSEEPPRPRRRSLTPLARRRVPRDGRELGREGRPWSPRAERDRSAGRGLRFFSKKMGGLCIGCFDEDNFDGMLL